MEDDKRVPNVMERLRRCGVDPVEVLEKALPLAETFAKIRRRDQTPRDDRRAYALACADAPKNLTTTDVSPVALLAKAAELLKDLDTRPALALHVAGAGHRARVAAEAAKASTETPVSVVEAVAYDPGALYEPEIAALVLQLKNIASEPVPFWWDPDGGTPPVLIPEPVSQTPKERRQQSMLIVDSRLPPLPEDFDDLRTMLVEDFLRDSQDPLLKLAPLLAIAGERPGEDVPLGAPMPLTPGDPDQVRQTRIANALLLGRHAALEALHRLACAFEAWSPTREVSFGSLELAASMLPKEMKNSERNRILSRAFGVNERTIRRAYNAEVESIACAVIPASLEVPLSEEVPGRKDVNAPEDQPGPGPAGKR